jgi:magnesium-transporting ATPase (P-type)
VVVGLLLAVLPPFLWGWRWDTTIYRALIFLVVASPCALMAAIMPALLSGIANGAKQGILFKNGAQLEKMGMVRAIAFDKTGTLTTGQPEVYKVIPVAGVSELKLTEIAAALEYYSLCLTDSIRFPSPDAAGKRDFGNGAGTACGDWNLGLCAAVWRSGVRCHDAHE